MKLEDIKVGMKVVPVSKSTGENFENWSSKARDFDSYKFFEANGYLIVNEVGHGEVLSGVEGELWKSVAFLPGDLVPYVEDYESDMVNHPNHYTNGNIEVIDYINDVCSGIEDGYQAYVVGNVIKYVSRAHLKNGVEDLKKAKWYLSDLIDRLENDE